MSTNSQTAGKSNETASGLPLPQVLYIPVAAALVALLFAYETRLTFPKNQPETKAPHQMKQHFPRYLQKSRSPRHQMLFAQRLDSLTPALWMPSQIQVAYFVPHILQQLTESLQFLDFSTIPQYQRPGGLVGSLSPPAGKSGIDLKPGDEMKATLGGMSLTLSVVENNETTFSWYGAWPSKMFNILAGVHTFSFTPSPSSTPSSPRTTFRQYERHEGMMSGVMTFEVAIKKANDGNMAWNEDLKKWVERTS